MHCSVRCACWLAQQCCRARLRPRLGMEPAASALHVQCPVNAKLIRRQHECGVQKTGGGEPQALVSSEFAAMLDLVILPELVKPYKAAGAAAFKQACINHAAKIGVHWTEVHYPFFISADNDRKHPWARKLMLKPRLASHRRQELEAQAQQFAASCTAGMSASMQAAAAAAPEADAQRMRRDACVAEHGCTPLQLFWRQKAEADDMPFLRTLHPEQWMPLVAKTPDIHQVVEHMVHNIKKHVKMRMRLDLGDEKQFSARTYQEYIRDAAQRQGNSRWARQNIRGSCIKQPLTCRVLQADEGVPVVLMHTSGAAHGRSRKRAYTMHCVAGTGGGWIAGGFK